MNVEGPPIKAVELMRQIRDEINAEMEGRSFEEIQRMIHEQVTKSELWRRLQEQKSSTSSR